jgi:hypothetical protein
VVHTLSKIVGILHHQNMVHTPLPSFSIYFIAKIWYILHLQKVVYTLWQVEAVHTHYLNCGIRKDGIHDLLFNTRNLKNYTTLSLRHMHTRVHRNKKYLKADYYLNYRIMQTAHTISSYFSCERAPCTLSSLCMGSRWTKLYIYMETILSSMTE